MVEPAQSVDSPAAFGTDERAVAKRWVSEIDIAEKNETRWRAAAKKVIRRYKDERPNEKLQLNPARKFSILWSNVETLSPAIYARTPKCVVTRRFKDEDPVGRMASEVLERAVNYGLDEYDFDQRMNACKKDYLLPGRGVAWMRYVPHLKSPDEVQAEGPQITTVQEAGEEEHDFNAEVTYEQVLCDHVNWDDFLHNPGREWDEVRWVARRVYMTRDELVERFGDKGKACPLDWGPKSDSPEKDEQFRKAVVYEVWDKAGLAVFWINKSYEFPLDTRPDPLNLTDFFPCPRPLYATLGPDSLIPVPDYVLYQDQAEELDLIEGRIGMLVEGLRLVGFYPGKENVSLQNVFGREKNNTLIPIESWTEFVAGGGSKGIIQWVPIDMVIEALSGLYEARERCLAVIYQITGIADIMRGDSDPVETATAQKLKGQWGSLRVRDRQKELARFARDICRIKGEIISEFFSPETLKRMTGVQMLDSPAQKQQIQLQLQQQAQMAQQTGQQPQQPPMDLMRMLNNPTWEEVMALLRDNAMRCFRIDIETDSTIDPNDQEQKQAATEFVTAMGSLIAAAKEAPPAIMPLVGETVKFMARQYRVGRELEDVIDKTVQAIQASPPQPEGQGTSQNDVAVAQIEQQTEEIKQQGEGQRAQIQAAMKQAEIPLRQMDQQLKLVALKRDPNPQAVSQG